MAAAPEGEVARVLPGDVETIRLGETLRIAVGSVHDRDHELAASDCLPAELDVRRGPAVQRPLHRPLVAQWIRGRSCSTTLGVNAFVTSRRSRR